MSGILLVKMRCSPEKSSSEFLLNLRFSSLTVKKICDFAVKENDGALQILEILKREA
jgi:hypothetical protein